MTGEPMENAEAGALPPFTVISTAAKLARLVGSMPAPIRARRCRELGIKPGHLREAAHLLNHLSTICAEAELGVASLTDHPVAGD